MTDRLSRYIESIRRVPKTLFRRLCDAARYGAGRHVDVRLSNYGFTISAVIALAAFSIASDSYWNPLSDQWRQTLGFAPKNLLDFQWHRLFTSLVLTAGEWKFIASFVMLGFCVGSVEKAYGTWRVFLLFLASHLAVLLTFSAVVLVATFTFQSDWATRLATTRDIGPSAGYYGCLGAILTRWPFKISLPGFALIIIVLVLRLSMSASRMPDDASVFSADLAHLLALPLGVVLAAGGFVQPLEASSSLDDSQEAEARGNASWEDAAS